jgi:hypothetical protein
MVPVRSAAPGFAPTVKVTPIAVVEAIAIQEAFAVAVNGQVLPVTPTAIELVPPLAGKTVLVGFNPNRQACPSWETVKICPPMVNNAVRGVVAGFAKREKETVPGPVPVAPEVIVTHESPVYAFQLIPACVKTLTLPVEAAAGKVPLSDDSASVGSVAPAAWFTINVRVMFGAGPEVVIVIVPVRSAPEFVEAVNESLPPPAPDVRLREIQEAEEVAFQEQAGGRSRSVKPAPPAPARAAAAGRSVRIEHGIKGCVTVRVCGCGTDV